MILYVRFAITTPFGICLQRCFVGFTAELAALFSITNFSKISCRELKTSKFCPKSYGTQPELCEPHPSFYFKKWPLIAILPHRLSRNLRPTCKP